MQILQECENNPALQSSSEESIRKDVSKANSFGMLKPTSPQVNRMATYSPSSGSAVDSRGDYPLSSRGSNLTKNRFSFQTFGTFGNGVDLSDTGSVCDEFSWATGTDGLHKCSASVQTSEPLALITNVFTIGKE